MVETTVVLHNPTGLHARPADRFAREANRFTADILVGKHSGKMVDAKSVLSILTLDGRHGDDILIRAEGEDAEDAVTHLSSFVSEGLGEDVAE